MIDLLRVVKLRYPGREDIRYVDNEDWVEFGGVEPAIESRAEDGHMEYQSFEDYETFLVYAQEQAEAGNLADWEGFVSSIPTDPLIVSLISQKAAYPGLGEALQDIMLLVLFPSARAPEFVYSFWTALVTEVRASGIEIPPSHVESWNQTVSDYVLPSWLKL